MSDKKSSGSVEHLSGSQAIATFSLVLTGAVLMVIFSVVKMYSRIYDLNVVLLGTDRMKDIPGIVSTIMMTGESTGGFMEKFGDTIRAVINPVKAVYEWFESLFSGGLIEAFFNGLRNILKGIFGL